MVAQEMREEHPLRKVGSDAVWKSGTGVPPVNHAQDACATTKLTHYQKSG